MLFPCKEPENCTTQNSPMSSFLIIRKEERQQHNSEKWVVVITEQNGVVGKNKKPRGSVKRTNNVASQCINT